MKKPLKIAGITLLSLLALLLLGVLLTRFVIRDQIASYQHKLTQEARCELLRAAGDYASDPKADFRFTYLQDTVRARELRTYFRLDTLINPAASTWYNTLTLATFVARNIPHANQSIQPTKRNAVALWEYHLQTEPAFNCRLHSILLHELLLASGITNRFVTCLPVDSLDTDCHVVNIVWLPEQQKWAMIDSDMQAFITSPEGDPLSLEEMRARYIADEPMVVHQLLDQSNTDYYVSYWAKNLYWFECWEQTGYDKEPHGKGRSIALLPPGFAGFELNDPCVRTSDAARFWAAPDNDTTF